jgi:hypothetical protein
MGRNREAGRPARNCGQILTRRTLLQSAAWTIAAATIPRGAELAADRKSVV